MLSRVRHWLTSIMVNRRMRSLARLRKYMPVKAVEFNDGHVSN